MRGLGARGPKLDPRISHPCFDFFPIRVAYVVLNSLKTEHWLKEGGKMSAPTASWENTLALEGKGITDVK